MSGDLTRGGLSPAKLTNLANTSDIVKFMFNPYEYSIVKQNTWTKESAKGQNLPRHVFESGGAQTLSLKLHFDTQTSGEDVRGHTDALWKMMMVDTTNINQTTGKGAPPAVAFEWGSGIYFKAIITSMTQKFTLFKADGIPIRCEVDVSLEQFEDETTFKPQIQGLGGATAATSTTIVIGTDRIDNVAAASGSNHRDVAAANNIDNPHNVPSGTTLNT
jgi:hypothetical protein